MVDGLEAGVDRAATVDDLAAVASVVATERSLDPAEDGLVAALVAVAPWVDPVLEAAAEASAPCVLVAIRWEPLEAVDDRAGSPSQPDTTLEAALSPNACLTQCARHRHRAGDLVRRDCCDCGWCCTSTRVSPSHDGP